MAEPKGGHPVCECGARIEVVTIPGYPQFCPRYCRACLERIDRERSEASLSQALEERGLVGRWATVTFDNLSEPKPKAAVIETCRLFSRTCQNGGRRGLYLWSPINGTGKTHLAAAIARGQDEGLFVNLGDLLAALRTSFTTDDRCYLYERTLRTPFLVLDDLGAHPAYDWVEEKLYTLVNERWVHNRATVVTSNFSPKELAERVGQRVVSRLLGFCDVVKVDGVDHRLRSARVIVR